MHVHLLPLAKSQVHVPASAYRAFDVPYINMDFIILHPQAVIFCSTPQIVGKFSSLPLQLSHSHFLRGGIRQTSENLQVILSHHGSKSDTVDASSTGATFQLRGSPNPSSNNQDHNLCRTVSHANVRFTSAIFQYLDLAQIGEI